jgi:glycerol-3-phosphate cytidylyltransferase
MNTIAYIPGVWDLLHVGHVTILEHAKTLCDRLVVGVPSNEVVKEDKGKYPIIPLQDRVRMLSALRCVDAVLPYYRLEFLTNLKIIQPDILVVGEKWGVGKRHREAEEWLHQNEGRLVILPYYQYESTSTIKQRVRG